jgi:hypothetical protein
VELDTGARRNVIRAAAALRRATIFEEAGFTKAADTSAVSGGFPRVVMRLDLR